MLDHIEQLDTEAAADLAGVASAEQLEQFRIKYLGSKGQLKQLMAQLNEVRAASGKTDKEIELLKQQFRSDQADIQAWEDAQRTLSAACDAYSEVLGAVATVASQHLKQTQCVSFQSVFSDLIHGAQQQQQLLLRTQAAVHP